MSSHANEIVSQASQLPVGIYIGVCGGISIIRRIQPPALSQVPEPGVELKLHGYNQKKRI